MFLTEAKKEAESGDISESTVKIGWSWEMTRMCGRDGKV
jgi:hypothetical protein